VVCAAWPLLKVREQYYDLKKLVDEACPEFESIDWEHLQTRLLVGATEVVNGIETTFDSDRNMPNQGHKHREPTVKQRWRERLPLSLGGVAASGTGPQFFSGKEGCGRYYWDVLYSQDPPILGFSWRVHAQPTP